MSGTDELIQIEPVELKFPYKPHTNVMSTVHVINKTNEYIAFKVLNLLKVGLNEHALCPSYGLMKPSSDINILVKLFPKTEVPPDTDYIDVFRVWSVTVTENAIVNSYEDVTDIMNMPGKVVHEVTLPVAYEQNQSDQASTNANTTDELVQMEPLELSFPYKPHTNVMSTVHIINKTNEYIAFKVLNLLKVGLNEHALSPSYGLIKPSSDINILVKLFPKTEAAPDMDYIDEFRVWSVIVTENAIVNSYEDVTDIMNVPGKITHEEVLPVGYVQDQSDQVRTNSKLVHVEPLEHNIPLPSNLHETAQTHMQQVNFQKPKAIEEEEEDGGGEKEEALSVSTQNANEFEALYYAEVQKRKKIEEELAIVGEELQQKIGYIKFEYDEMKKATHDFAESCKIGEGGFSDVYKGSVCGEDMAIKKLKFNDEQGFKEEVETLSEVRHPNIITLIGACNDKVNPPILVYEYLPKGSLEDHLNCRNNASPLPGHARIRIALEICCALSFLHSIPRAHADLKPDNILLNTNFVSKLSDFGTSRKLKLSENSVTPSHQTTNVKGTFAYMDPDHLSSARMTPQGDIFSFGVVLLRLATGKGASETVEGTAMPIRDLVEIAIAGNTFDTLVDVEWPSKGAPKKMAELGLQCFERRWRRPNAASLFKSLMDIASDR